MSSEVVSVLTAYALGDAEEIVGYHLIAFYYEKGISSNI